MTEHRHRLRPDRGLARLHHEPLRPTRWTCAPSTVGCAVARTWSARSSTRRPARSCPTAWIGEFVARGYNIMKGYYKMPDATAAAIDEDGWLHTGDLACRDARAATTSITGRLKDMIIRGGENIYPKEIEDFIYHPSQGAGRAGHRRARRAVRRGDHGLHHPQGGRDHDRGGDQAIMMRNHMARHKVPRYIELCGRASP